MANNKLINLKIGETFIYQKKFSLSAYSVKQLFVRYSKEKSITIYIFSYVFYILLSMSLDASHFKFI